MLGICSNLVYCWRFVSISLHQQCESYGAPAVDVKCGEPMGERAPGRFQRNSSETASDRSAGSAAVHEDPCEYERPNHKTAKPQRDSRDEYLENAEAPHGQDD